MSHLGMEFLGGFRVTQDGIPLTNFESNKVRALLAYLAIESQRPHPRSSLAALLWPDWPDRSALSNLRYALSDLRKATGDRRADPPFLLISREAIQFNLESDHSLDVAEFTQLSDGPEVERLEQAVSLYKGEFLEGFSVGDAAPFEDWARLKAEQLHRTFLESLHLLAECLECGGEVGRALSYARQGAAAEPLDERAQRQVMHLLALSGRRSEALAQYEACREFLDNELGASPSAETTRLYEQILAGELEGFAPATFITAPYKPPAALETFPERERPVFVARERELKRLNCFLEAGLAGKGCVAFVTGGAGRGKTALLREFAWRASEAHPDLLVAAGSCNPYSGVGDPYLPLRTVLRSLMGNLDLAGSTGMIGRAQARSLSQALPQALGALLSSGSYLVGTFIPGGELLAQAESMGVIQPELRRFVEQSADKPYNLAQQHLFEQYFAVLRALSRDHPLLLLLDDLQWADSASAGLLYHLAGRLEGSRILAVCAYRPEEVALGRAGERHPLEKALVEIRRLCGEAWLDLNRSDENSGRDFVEVFLDSEPNRLGGGFREQLFERTEGHALFTIELLRAMRERGDLFKDPDGIWVEGPVLDWESLPARVEAVIAERIGRLDEGLHQTLSIASVEGEDFTAQVAARVKGVGEGQMLGELSRQLERRHRLVREQGELQIGRETLSRYRFGHALYQQYLYSQLGNAERRLLHGATAQALERLYGEHAAEIAPQLAHHWGEAKDKDKAREYLLLAGQEALGAYANLEAESHFRGALGLGPADRERAALLEGLGEALRRLGRRDEVVPVLRQGIDIYRQLGDLEGAARLYLCLSRALFNWDNCLDAWEACQEGMGLLEGAPDGPGLARLLAEAGRTAFFMHEAAAEEQCRRAIQMAERLGVPEAQAEARITLAMMIDDRYGNYTQTIQMLEEVIPFCETHGLWFSAQRAHINLGAWLGRYAIDIHSAYQQYLQAAELARQVGDIDQLFFCLENVAEGYLVFGNLAPIESVLANFLQQSTATKEQIRRFFEEKCSSTRVRLIYRGEWVQACETFRTLLENSREKQSFQNIAFNYFYLGYAQIELHCLTGTGDLAEAEAALVENLEMKEAVHISQTRLVKVYSLQGRFSEAHALLVELFKAPLKYRLEAKAIHALAERRWNQAASLTLKLIDLLQTTGFRWEWARALIDLGDIYAQRNQPGDPERAREAYQCSWDMFTEMEAPGYIQVLRQRLQSIPPI
jgi:DNA-binding SARP family transcriptional activator/tetratricopeptide (TPR) repeat protein